VWVSRDGTVDYELVTEGTMTEHDVATALNRLSSEERTRWAEAERVHLEARAALAFRVGWLEADVARLTQQLAAEKERTRNAEHAAAKLAVEVARLEEICGDCDRSAA
jgi:hypothetical protein